MSVFSSTYFYISKSETMADSKINASHASTFCIFFCLDRALFDFPPESFYLHVVNNFASCTLLILFHLHVALFYLALTRLLFNNVTSAAKVKVTLNIFVLYHLFVRVITHVNKNTFPSKTPPINTETTPAIHYFSNAPLVISICFHEFRCK